MQRNLNDWERAASVAAGAALIALVARRASARLGVTAAGTGLIARGLTGFCPVSAILGRNSRLSETREQLGGNRGIHVRESITIARPLDEVYDFWRDLSNLPRFMAHLERVEVLGSRRSRWTATAPAGLSVTWDAEIINEVQDEVIGWRSLEGADVASAGAVQFKPTPAGTQIIVHLQYNPPGGKLGAWVATLLGEDPSMQIREDLWRLKSFLETGESPSGDERFSRRFGVPAYDSADGNVRPFRRTAYEGV